ncbi:unnamed protein product, partial [Effrenium voratum]
MRDQYQKEEFHLMYEVTSKMVADIYTKAFTDAVRWKHACLLINIFQGEEMVDKDVLDALRPTHDVKSGTLFLKNVLAQYTPADLEAELRQRGLGYGLLHIHPVRKGALVADKPSVFFLTFETWNIAFGR